MKKINKFLIGVYNPSIILTYISVFCSLSGIGLLVTQRPETSFDALSFSMILLVIAGVCDMFDGRIARMCKRTEQEKLFGIQLDSLADTVSFGVFPAVILIYATQGIWYGYLISMFYLFAGIMRLGWFNVTTETNNDFYQGVPITYSALVLPTIQLIINILNISWYPVIYAVCFLINGILFIVNIKIPKTGLKASIALLLLAIFVIIGLLLL